MGKGDELMILEASISTLDELYDNMVRNYELGYFVEGISEWNGDDALMSPRSFAHTFKTVSYTHLTLPTNRGV